jgi:phosphoribosylanthranilate isomerase
MAAHSVRQPATQSKWPPRVQVAGVSSLEEALFCHRVGVDALGFTLELLSGIHDGLTRAVAASIVREIPHGLLPVVITYLTRAAEARELVEEVKARAVQFHGGISHTEIILFRRRCPHVRTIGRVTVSGENAVQEATRFTPRQWDAIILDSRDAATGRIGATGLIHDWSISARIVQAASVPVILAGGLTPENVAEAIRIVRPAGVDAHTGLEKSDGSRDFAKIAAFSRAALAAFHNLQSP